MTAQKRREMTAVDCGEFQRLGDAALGHDGVPGELAGYPEPQKGDRGPRRE
jgi:hypothetical protein